jgi:hypothetical protein
VRHPGILRLGCGLDRLTCYPRDLQSTIIAP